MTVTIELPADIEADLVAQARAHGLELQQCLEHLLREHVLQQTGRAFSQAEIAAAWRDSTRGLPHAPPLSDRDISRENIYHGGEGLADQLEEIAEHCASLPVLDARRAEEILGYDPAGLPRRR